MVLMKSEESILKYSWGAFLKTPFSLLFFALVALLIYLIYIDKSEAQADKIRYENEIKDCNESRLKDTEVYSNLLRSLQINNSLKHDSI